MWKTKWVSGKVSCCVNIVDQCESCLTLKSLDFKIHDSPVSDYWPVSFCFQLSCQDHLQSSSPPCVIFQLSCKNCTSRALSWLLSTLLCNQLMKKRKLPRNKSSGLCLSRKQKGKVFPVNWDKNRQCDFLLSFDLHQEIVAEFTVQDLIFFKNFCWWAWIGLTCSSCLQFVCSLAGGLENNKLKYALYFGMCCHERQTNKPYAWQFVRMVLLVPSKNLLD